MTKYGIGQWEAITYISIVYYLYIIDMIRIALNCSLTDGCGLPIGGEHGRTTRSPRHIYIIILDISLVAIAPNPDISKWFPGIIYIDKH